MAGDLLVGGHPADLVDGVVHRALLGDRTLATTDRGDDLCDAENRADTQPPLRPDAPKPAISASSTAMRQRRVGR